MPSAVTNANAPRLDNFATQRLLHKMFVQNVVQGLLHKNGRGITDEYTSDVMTDEIRVIRQEASDAGFRELGATGTNTRSFNKLDFQSPVSDYYGVKIRQLFDRPYEIAQVQMDMLPLDIIGSTSRIIEQRVTKIINAFTMAIQIGKALNYSLANDGDGLYVLGSTETVLEGFLRANVQLDEGDEENGQDTFELTGRMALLRGDAVRLLKTSVGGVFDMNNVTAQELLRVGSLSEPEKEMVNTRIDGYRGDVDAVPIIFAGGGLFKLAEEILGLTAGDLDDLLGYVCASEATARGIAFGGVDIDKHPTGRGVLLKPLFRWGAEVFFPRGIKLIASNGFTAPIANVTITATDNSLPVED